MIKQFEVVVFVAFILMHSIFENALVRHTYTHTPNARALRLPKLCFFRNEGPLKKKPTYVSNIFRCSFTEKFVKPKSERDLLGSPLSIKPSQPLNYIKISELLVITKIWEKSTIKKMLNTFIFRNHNTEKLFRY